MIRLALRVARGDAEAVLAELLELAPAGLEERELGDDARFVRDRDDLHTVIDVPAPLAALGTTVRVPSLDGELPVEIPAGTQPGEVITLGARGLPPLGRGRTGDLHVHVNVVIPRKLSREQRALLQQLADSLTERNTGGSSKTK